MTVTTQDIATVLGLDGNRRFESALALAEAMERGFPVGTVKRVSQAIAPDDPSFRFRLVAKATLARRRRDNRLSLAESERIERYARLWAFARDVFRDEAAARRFLAQPHPLLGGRTPLDVSRTDLGARMVEDILGRLQYGSAA